MNKVKVYRNIICLEVRSRDGAKWWYQGGSLAYTPMHIKELLQISFGRLKTTGKQVLTTAVDIDGVPQLVAINTVRSDMAALVENGFLPEDYLVDKVQYTAYPRNQNQYTDEKNARPTFYV